MELQDLYKVAINSMLNNMNAVRASRGDISIFDNMSLCVILTKKQYFYMGSNDTKTENGISKNTCAEYEAVSAMKRAGESEISQMITVEYKTNKVVTPCYNCLEMIVRTHQDNINCEISTSPNESVTLEKLLEEKKPVSSGSIEDNFDFEPADTPLSSVDYVTEISADESNEFYEPPKKTNTFQYDIPDDAPSYMKRAFTDNIRVLNKAPSHSSSMYVNQDTNNMQNPQQQNGYAPYPNNYYGSYNQPNQPYQGQQNYNTYPQQQTSNYNPYNQPYQQNQPSPSQYFQPVSNYGDNSGFISQQSAQTSVPSANTVRDSLSSVSFNSSSSTADNDSIYKQRLNDLLKTDTATPTPKSVDDEKLDKVSKLELLKQAKEKKKQAKIDAKFAKKMKKKGFDA